MLDSVPPAAPLPAFMLLVEAWWRYSQIMKALLILAGLLSSLLSCLSFVIRDSVTNKGSPGNKAVTIAA
jgi:hypothetical protein